MKTRLFFLLVCTWMAASVSAQEVTASREAMIYLTQEWKGDRYPDGRPKVDEKWLNRVVNISIEEAWGYLRNKGYHNQFASGWEMLHPDQPFAGRALTAQYLPLRPEFGDRLRKEGNARGRIGPPNSWPIDLLQNGDVYVADGYGKIQDGTLIGDNLGNAIYAKSKKGVVFDAGARDLEGLEKIEGFNAFVRGWDPSYLQQSMLMAINQPVRIGQATVFPGDVVLAKREGVIFIPPHFVEDLVIHAEFIQLRDEFGITRLKEGKYTPGQIDTEWTDAIKKDFLKWLDANPEKIPMTRAELDAFMKERNW